MTTLLTILSSVLGGGLVAVVGVLIWLERRREPEPPAPPTPPEPTGLDETTDAGLIPSRPYLREVTDARPPPLADAPDDPRARDRAARARRAILAIHLERVERDDEEM